MPAYYDPNSDPRRPQRKPQMWRRRLQRELESQSVSQYSSYDYWNDNLGLPDDSDHACGYYGYGWFGWLGCWIRSCFRWW